MASTADSVYLLTADGKRVPGWPRHLELTTGNGRAPSPVLAPLRRHLGDPTLCVVVCGANGQLIAFDAQSDDGTIDIHAVQVATGAEGPLIPGDPNDEFAAWGIGALEAEQSDADGNEDCAA